MPRAQFLAKLSLLSLAIGTLACSDSNPTAPLRAIEITVKTEGATADLDPDGYTLFFDNSGQSIRINDLVRFSAVHTGQHLLQLNGIAPNCTLEGPNPYAVDVVAGEPSTLLVTFSVRCGATIPVDPWGY